jgi:hypothetical protein
MVCSYLSYLKESLGQTLLYKILVHPKNHSFFFQLLKKYIHYLSISFPVVYFVTCILKLTFIRILNLINLIIILIKAIFLTKE